MMSRGWTTRAALLVLGVSGSVAVWFAFPDPDPLAGTARIAPLVLALLASVRWAIGEAGGRPTRAGELAVAAALLVAWTLAAALRTSGWVGTSRLGVQLLLGALVLLLATVTARAMVAARPLLRPGRRTHGCFFALPALLYLALLPWHSAERAPDGDEPYYLLLVDSLVHDRDLDLANQYENGSDLQVSGRRLEPQPGDPTGPNGEQYSRHNLLLPIVLAPAYAIAGVSGALATMALLAALVAYGFLEVARRYGSGGNARGERAAHTGAALIAYGALVFGAPWVVYSYQVWVEVPAAGLTLVGLLGFGSAAERGRSGERLAATVAILLLPMLKVRFLLLSASLVALALLRSRSRRTLLPIAGLLAALVGGIVVVNTVLFGNPLKYHDAAPLLATLFDPAASLRGLVGLFFDSAFGLFAFAPIWLALIPGTIATVRRHRALAADLAVLALPYLAVVAPRLEWYGGWGPPFRYAIVLLPALALVAIPAFEHRRKRGAGVALSALAAATGGVALLYLVDPGSSFTFADGRSAWLDRLTQSLGVDVARIAPSYVRLRSASWLWPVLLPPLLLLAWRLRPLGRTIGAGTRRSAGTAVVVATLALALFAAERLPTRTVEFEDPYVEHRGGDLYPEQWRPARAAFRGGWFLAKGDEIALRPRAGGSQLEIEVDLRTQRERAGATVLVVYQGTRELCRESIPAGNEWRTISCPIAEWDTDSSAPLTIALEQDERLKRRRPRVILDRARLDWSNR